MSKPVKQIAAYLKDMLLRYKRFTGKLELNFKDGVLKDINETRRTKCVEEDHTGIL